MRGKQTVRDMMLSILVMGVVVAGLYIFLPHGGTDPVKTVSYNVELGQARHAAPYPVAAPEGLPKQWRATSVTYDGSDPKASTWHLGFIDPQGQYASVDQSNGAAGAFVSTTTQQSTRHGTQTVAGQTWDRYTGGRYQALARTEHGVTTVVDGTAPFSQLAELAAALRT
ncbi:DUF4245 domain-containing protein [Streptomyces sp. PTM05]|uniref:DUF4245 domain-containing protein n=1 Tax=Streptantibioticus parmotrematis TaxID=2873249 RepID=A0ABS7QLL5_9ACTN|nr:DUF4245 domain-containing protein [Streptantibioticus parmotrematis]MBY8884082.1 DUF4245 domain-containing protein [Streptantibioticus parmotrematis]